MRMIRAIVAEGTTPAETVAIALIVAAKFALPVLIVRFPFVAGWANFFLDGFDGDWLIPLGLPNEIYQPVDKITDWVTYVAIVVVAFRNDWPTKRLMLGLFLFRSIGQVGFLVTGNVLLLAFFPNFLEPLFLVTVTILAFERVIRHYPDWQERGFEILYRYRWLIGTVIVIYKLQDECITHVGNIDRTEFLEQLLAASRGCGTRSVGRSLRGPADSRVARPPTMSSWRRAQAGRGRRRRRSGGRLCTERHRTSAPRMLFGSRAPRRTRTASVDWMCLERSTPPSRKALRRPIS